MLWDATAPILIPMLILGIVVVIIRKIIVSGAYDIFRITGGGMLRISLKK